MFGKKKVVNEWSFEDREIKRLSQSMREHMTGMEIYCRKILECEGIANCLPNGADKQIEIDIAEDYKKRLLNLVSAYDDDYREYNKIDKSKCKYYNEIAKKLNSHEILKIAWKQALRSLYK